MVFSALLQRIDLEIGQCERAYSTWAEILFPRSKKCTSLVASNVEISYSSCSEKPMNGEQELRVCTSVSMKMNEKWQKLVN